MHRKRPQVLGVDLNRSESRRRAACRLNAAQAPDFTYSCQASTEHFEQWAEIARSALNRSDHLTVLRHRVHVAGLHSAYEHQKVVEWPGCVADPD